MSFRPLFGQITILSLSFITFRVSRFHVSHLTHETFKLGLQNTLNMSKTARVYFGMLQKTSFVTGQGTYCYRVMPIGLKNAGATYHWLVNRMFQKQIGTSMEVYIDDMLVKSTTAELHIAHLAEAFQILKKYNMKLNPAKCAFGVSFEKFLGFIFNN